MPLACLIGRTSNPGLLLSGENLVNPRPGTLYELWLSDHPSLADRVDFANTYRPWEEGDRGRYEGRFPGPRN